MKKLIVICFILFGMVSCHSGTSQYDDLESMPIVLSSEYIPVEGDTIEVWTEGKSRGIDLDRYEVIPSLTLTPSLEGSTAGLLNAIMNLVNVVQEYGYLFGVNVEMEKGEETEEILTIQIRWRR